MQTGFFPLKDRDSGDDDSDTGPRARDLI